MEHFYSLASLTIHENPGATSSREDFRGKFFTERVVRNQNRMPLDVPGWCSRTGWLGPLADWSSIKCGGWQPQGGWILMIPEIPSNASHSTILRLGKQKCRSTLSVTLTQHCTPGKQGGVWPLPVPLPGPSSSISVGRSSSEACPGFHQAARSYKTASVPPSHSLTSKWHGVRHDSAYGDPSSIAGARAAAALLTLFQHTTSTHKLAPCTVTQMESVCFAGKKMSKPKQGIQNHVWALFHFLPWKADGSQRLSFPSHVQLC